MDIGVGFYPVSHRTPDGSEQIDRRDTQAGETLSVATAARPVTRQTAERALAQFLERVARVNDDPYFLARVTRVALYGSMLRPEVERLSDVDLAVQMVAKEPDFERLRKANAERIEQLAVLGQRFSNFLEEQFCWFLETFRLLKGRSRVISLRLQRGEAFGVGGPPSNAARGTRRA